MAPGAARLLTGGNPQIPKGDGDGRVQAHIAAMQGWKRAVGARIDALATGTVPSPAKAARWNAPFRGVAGQGWMLGLGCTGRYVKVVFLTGGHPAPPPPVASKHAQVFHLHRAEGDGREKDRFAARMPGGGDPRRGAVLTRRCPTASPARPRFRAAPR